jgi:hypothetical protein
MDETNRSAASLLGAPVAASSATAMASRRKRIAADPRRARAVAAAQERLQHWLKGEQALQQALKEPAKKEQTVSGKSSTALEKKTRGAA